MVRSFPYTPAGGTEQFTAEAIRWLDPNHLVYLGQQFSSQAICPTCPVDTLRATQAVTILDLGSPTSPTAIPGTAMATGVAVAPGGDALFYTLAGDSRVFRLVLASSDVQIAHDFGSAGVARDVQTAGNRITAVVGGRVVVGPHPVLGSVQYDSGGVIHVVDLGTGMDMALDPGARLFRHPALSPLGDRLAAEGYPLIITLVAPATETTPPIYDTTVGRSGDIYLFGAP
jgi:hypothetical protein